MSIDYEQDRERYRVRWRENGRQRSRRFGTQEEAVAFAATIAPADDEPGPREQPEPDGGGVWIPSAPT